MNEDRELTIRQDERFRHWLIDIQNIIKQMHIEDSVQVDEKLLGKAVVDYFEDIDRLKRYEEIERANVNKIYGYEIYWILRRKPIQIIEPNELDERYLYINEKVCVALLISRMFKEAGIPLDSTGKRTKEFIDLMYYNFKYRTVTQKSLELMIEAFLCGCELRENKEDAEK